MISVSCKRQYSLYNRGRYHFEFNLYWMSHFMRHPTGRTLISDCFINTFIIIVYEIFFKYGQNSLRLRLKSLSYTTILKLFMNQSEVSALSAGCEGYIQKCGGPRIFQKEEGVANPLLCKILAESSMNMKKLGPGGAIRLWHPPLDPPLKSYSNPMAILWLWEILDPPLLFLLLVQGRC